MFGPCSSELLWAAAAQSLLRPQEGEGKAEEGGFLWAVFVLCCQSSLALRPQAQLNVSICDVEHKSLPKQTGISTLRERYVAAAGVQGWEMLPHTALASTETNYFSI